MSSLPKYGSLCLEPHSVLFALLRDSHDTLTVRQVHVLEDRHAIGWDNILRCFEYYVQVLGPERAAVNVPELYLGSEEEMRTTLQMIMQEPTRLVSVPAIPVPRWCSQYVHGWSDLRGPLLVVQPDQVGSSSAAAAAAAAVTPCSSNPSRVRIAQINCQTATVLLQPCGHVYTARASIHFVRICCLFSWHSIF